MNNVCKTKNSENVCNSFSRLLSLMNRDLNKKVKNESQTIQKKNGQIIQRNNPQNKK